MTIEMAMKAIESQLSYYLPRVPKSLLNNIEVIVKSAKTIIKKEVLMPDKKADPPDLPKIWAEICASHKIDLATALKSREAINVSVRTHFVRYVILNYSGVTLTSLARFLKKDHSTIIHMRDLSKTICPIPPLSQRKIIIKKIK